MPSSTGNVCLYFVAIFIPFLPVLIRRGCGADLLINICLDILGWIPGAGSDSTQYCIHGGLSANLRSTPTVWAEQMGGVRTKVVQVEIYDDAIGYEIKGGRT